MPCPVTCAPTVSRVQRSGTIRVAAAVAGDAVAGFKHCQNRNQVHIVENTYWMDSQYRNGSTMRVRELGEIREVLPQVSSSEMNRLYKLIIKL